MFYRKRGYLIGLFLIAFICSVPQLAFFGGAAAEYSRSRSLPVHSIPGFSRIPISHKSELIQAPFWNDQFVILDIKPVDAQTRTLTLRTFDPESGSTSRPLDVAATCVYTVESFENRLWIFPQDPSAQSYELIDGAAQKSDVSFFKNSLDEGASFLIEGEPACVSQVNNELAVFTPRRERRDWIPTKSLGIPDLGCEWSYNDTTVHMHGDLPDFKLIRDGDQIHVFLSMNGYVLYRQGIEFIPKAPDQQPVPIQAKVPLKVSSKGAEKSSADDPELAEWSLVCDSPAIVSAITMKSSRRLAKGAMLIEGKPAVLIIEQVQPQESIGTIHRFDGTSWSPWVTQSFPFALSEFRTATRSDGQSAYIVGATKLGEAFIYLADAGGVQPLQPNLPHPAIRNQLDFAVVYGIFVGSNLLCALGV